MVLAHVSFADTLDRIRGALPLIGADRWHPRSRRNRLGFRGAATASAAGSEAGAGG
jgi:hypothetical protein